MENLIANKPLKYDGRDLKIGEHFRADKRHAYILRAMGWAYDPPKVAFVEEFAPWEDDAPKPKPKRKYRRRDMTAVDE